MTQILKFLKTEIGNIALLAISIFLMLAMFSCNSGEDVKPQNNAPTISQAPGNVSLDEGFETSTVSLSGVFTDEDGDQLTMIASSSNTNVVTVDISGTTLTITEAGTGSSTITVTANDGNNGEVSTSFTVSVNKAGNTNPVVKSEIPDMSLSSGFGTESLKLPEYFSDAETQKLGFSATSSNESVVTVSINAGDLTITEVGMGTSTITVTAMDEDGGTVSDDFKVTIETTTCANDNSTDQNNTGCPYTPAEANQYDESVSNGMRTITTNRVPDHDYGNQVADMGISGLTSTVVTMSFTANPTLANKITNVVTDNYHPAYAFGVAVNGVPIDPAPAEPFIFENSSTGEFNWDWVYEPNNNMNAVGLDCNIAHLQPDQSTGTGLIHYHGDMMVFADDLYQGISSGTVPDSPLLIGWAGDGFPIVYKYGPTSSGNGVELLHSSYQLKSGTRPGDGTTAPCGAYNGKYTNDYEYVDGAGDLDECNGIQRSITLTTPAGLTETFTYFYVVTDEFPVLSRCFWGSPDDYFAKGQGKG